jgi:uncharacterized membrane protein
MLLFKRIVGVLLGAITLIVALLFSVVIFAVVLVVVAIAIGYLWWKTRALRRAAKAGENPHSGQFGRREHAGHGGRTIEATEVYEVQSEVIEDQSKRPPR